MSESQENPENSTSEQLSAILASLTVDQIKYVIARQDTATDKEAAEAVGVKPNTVYKWPPEVDAAVRLLAVSSVEGARALMQRSLLKAVQMKIGALDSDSESVQQKAATEIIEWIMGRAAQPVTGKDGESIPIQIIEVFKAKDRD